MSKCQNCNAEFPEGDKFCIGCGSGIDYRSRNTNQHTIVGALVWTSLLSVIFGIFSENELVAVGGAIILFFFLYIWSIEPTDK